MKQLRDKLETGQVDGHAGCSVAAVSPPMMAIAIGPQNTLCVSGIIASAVAAAVNIQMMRLRRKLELDPGDPKYIRTDGGVGPEDVPIAPRRVRLSA